MRGYACLLVGLFLTGCFGAPAAPDEPLDVPAPPPALLRVLVVDLEIRPLPGAKVTLEEPPGTTVTDDQGRAQLPVPGPGSYRLVVQAPGFYENRTRIEAKDLNASHMVSLPERPEYLVEAFNQRVLANCRSVRVESVHGERACTDPPSATRRISVDHGLVRLEAYMDWSGMAPEMALRLRFVHGDDAATLADGRTQVDVAGPPPLVIDLRGELQTAALQQESWQVEVQGWPSPDPSTVEAYDQDFTVDFYGVYHRPPPERACDLHPIPCE